MKRRDRFEPVVHPDVEKRIIALVVGFFAAILIALCVSTVVWPTPPALTEGRAGVAEERSLSRELSQAAHRP